MLKSLLKSFQVPPELLERKRESDATWNSLRTSINQGINEQIIRMNLHTELSRNGNMRLARRIQSEREKLLKQ